MKRSSTLGDLHIPQNFNFHQCQHNFTFLALAVRYVWKEELCVLFFNFEDIFLGSGEMVPLWLLFRRTEILFQERKWQHITMSIHILFACICMLFVCMYTHHACGCSWRIEDLLPLKSQSLFIFLICFWELKPCSESSGSPLNHWVNSPVTVYSSHISEIDLYQFFLRIFLTMLPHQKLWWCVGG